MPTFLYYKKLACWGNEARGAERQERCGLRSLAAPRTHLGRLADLEQVEPVGVPVVDDVGEFPPLLLSAPRHSQIPTKSRNNPPFSSLGRFYPLKRASYPTTWNKSKSVTPRNWAFKRGFCGERRSFPQSPVNAPQLYRRPLVLFPRSRLWFVLSRSVRAPRGKAVRAPSIDSWQNSLGTLTGTRTGTNVILGHKTSHKGQFFLLRFINHLKAG